MNNNAALVDLTHIKIDSESQWRCEEGGEEVFIGVWNEGQRGGRPKFRLFGCKLSPSLAGANNFSESNLDLPP